MHAGFDQLRRNGRDGTAGPAKETIVPILVNAQNAGKRERLNHQYAPQARPSARIRKFESDGVSGAVLSYDL